jgi:hypothetical protein
MWVAAFAYLAATAAETRFGPGRAVASILIYGLVLALPVAAMAVVTWWMSRTPLRFVGSWCFVWLAGWVASGLGVILLIGLWTVFVDSI